MWPSLPLGINAQYTASNVVRAIDDVMVMELFSLSVSGRVFALRQLSSSRKGDGAIAITINIVMYGGLKTSSS